MYADGRFMGHPPSLDRAADAAHTGLRKDNTRYKVLASNNSVRFATFALTSLVLYHIFHAASTPTHPFLSAVIAHKSY